MVVLGRLGAELEPGGHAPGGRDPGAGLRLVDLALGEAHVIADARIGEVGEVGEIAAAGLGDPPVDVAERGTPEVEAEAGERVGGHGLRAGAGQGHVLVGGDGVVEAALDEPGAAPVFELWRQGAGLGELVLVVGRQGEGAPAVDDGKVVQPVAGADVFGALEMEDAAGDGAGGGIGGAERGEAGKEQQEEGDERAAGHGGEKVVPAAGCDWRGDSPRGARLQSAFDGQVEGFRES